MTFEDIMRNCGEKFDPWNLRDLIALIIKLDQRVKDLERRVVELDGIEHRR